MSQLSAQSIRRFCEPCDEFGSDPAFRTRCNRQDGSGLLPMISPFMPDKTVINGKSYGLSAASYDLRIAHDLVLGPHPGHILALRLQDCPKGHPSAALATMWDDVRKTPPAFAIAHTIEDVAIPHNVVGYIKDKSTYARLGMSAFNTLFDPGFVGNCTLELVNFSDEPIVICAGDPICQMVFHWLDRPTDRPYMGKYQHQPKQAVAAILEGVAGD